MMPVFKSSYTNKWQRVKGSIADSIDAKMVNNFNLNLKGNYNRGYYGNNFLTLF